MGKGDKRSKRGKIWRGTNGKCRPKKSNGIKAVSAAPAVKAAPKAPKVVAPKAAKPASTKKPAAK